MARDTFSHEKLIVYQKALAFVADAEMMLAGWDRKHAVTDHLSRASESIIVNLAAGCRARAGRGKQLATDYSLGSILECAACLDIASVKGLASPDETKTRKQQLAEVARMTVGLRESWGSQSAHEGHGSYGTAPASKAEKPLFNHEGLDVYQAALGFMTWFCSDGFDGKLPGRLFAKIDQAATSILLNVAEGNGRFCALDHRKFLDTANAATVRAAGYLDVCVHKRILKVDEVEGAKHNLGRVADMTAAMAGLAGGSSKSSVDEVLD